ncbi:MAG: DNA repair protein RecN [Candidatus Nanopelagicales bacterium]|nr:DNA repair protein RecN [Candidatus Nanopelagicales bacterium]
MINDLRIQNIGVIEDVSLEMSAGFTVLTGETGAGKTMILTAFQMVIGEKVDNNLVRANEKTAVVEAFIQVPNDKNIRARLEELDIAIEDGGTQLSRTIAREGRGKIILGGRSVPSATLEEITQSSITIHGQGDQVLLNKPNYQRELIDQFAGQEHLKMLQNYQELYAKYVETRKRLEELNKAGSQNALRISQLQESLKELTEANLEIDEEITITERINLINNSEDIFESLALADKLLNGGEDSSGSISSQINSARKALDAAAAKSDRIASLRDQISNLEAEISNVASDVNRDLSSLDRDPATIDKLESRRALIKKMLTKYGPTSKDALANIQIFQNQLLDIEDLPAAIENVEKEIKTILNELSIKAQILHDTRIESALNISKAIEKELTSLSIPNAKFQVSVETNEDPQGLKITIAGKDHLLLFDNHGVNQISFEFSANPGQPLRPITKVASGGEMSRIMLAVELVFSQNVAAKTMIFDEVDAGIGGAAAIEVGKRLKALAQHHQIVVVTHLPQVAAFADKHLKVEKSATGNVTTSSVTELDPNARVTEIARMMAGIEDSASALEHARELLGMSHT